MDECPKYVALSYAWGRPPENCTVTINGRRHLVRKNLWRFLREARHTYPGKTTHLWIDALCIDQSNLDERAEQVAIMATIYQSAASVTIWLGPSYAGSDVAMRSLSAIARSKKKKVWYMAQAAGIHAAVLSRRAYWTRLWVFQEIVLARHLTLMCGRLTAPWAPFREMLLAPKTTHHEPDVAYQIIKDSPAVAVARRTQLEFQVLYDLIFSTRDLQCTDPRDRVYALLGVCSTESRNIATDYAKPLSSLLNDVLREHHKTRPPSNFDEIEQQCEQLSGCFGLSDDIYQMDEEFSNSIRDARNDHLLTPPGSTCSLWWAMRHDHVPIIVLLMKDAKSWISEAVHGGCLQTLDIILKANARARKDPYYTDLRDGAKWTRQCFSNYPNRESTALCTAFHEGGREDLDLSSLEGRFDDALSIASGLGQVGLVEILLDCGAHWSNGLDAAITRGQKATFELLIERSAGVMPYGSSLEPLLYKAVRKGDLCTVK